jgi:hypothetical protein
MVDKILERLMPANFILVLSSVKSYTKGATTIPFYKTIFH